MASVSDYWVTPVGPAISGHDGDTIIYDEMAPHPEPAKAMRPDWLGVGKDGDSVPWEPSAHWTSDLTVYDIDNQVWVYRITGNYELVLACEDEPPRDAERVALMFLVFAEEEEALNES